MLKLFGGLLLVVLIAAGVTVYFAVAALLHNFLTDYLMETCIQLKYCYYYGYRSLIGFCVFIFLMIFTIGLIATACSALLPEEKEKKP